MVEKLSTLETTNSIDNSIPVTALRTFITSFQRPIAGVPAVKATQDAYAAISKVLIPRLVGYAVNSVGLSKAQPSPLPGMLEVRADRNINSDSIDVLIDMIRCFGPMLQDSEKKALQKATLAIFDQSRTSPMIKKKAISAIALLAVYISDSQLDALISHTEKTFGRPDLSSSQHRLLIAMMGSLARSIPQRLGPFLKTLIPFIFNILSDQEFQQALEDIAENGAPNPEAEEVREAALVALECFLLSCSNDMRPFTDDAIEAGLGSVCYDPNVTVDEEDDAMSGTQHEEEDDPDGYDSDDEDFEEEGALSDDDDGSWKIRRCGAKVLYAIISTRSSGDLLDNGLLYQKIAPVLISRFVEREENVRLEVLSTLTSLIRKTSDGVVPLISSLTETEFEIPTTIEARSRKRRRLGSDATLFDSPGAALSSVGFNSPGASPPPTSGPRADLARLSSTIIRGVSKLLKQSPFATKQAAIALLHAMVTVQRGGLSEHFPKIADPLIDATKSSTGGSTSHSLGSAASATGSKLRIEALQLVSTICDTHSSGIFVPYITNLIPAVAAAVKDKYFKISSEGILAVESLVKMLTPPRSASAEKASSRSIAHLHDVVLDRALATDADLEVRQRAIHALGVLLARSTGPKVGVLSVAQKNNAARVLLDRMKNETTRHAAVRAFDIFVVSVQDPKELQADWVQNVALELGAQLRKADRSLRGASLAALRDLIANPVALNTFNDDTVSSLAGMLLPLVNSNDLNLLGMTVVILAKLVHHSPRKVVDQNLNNAVCEVVITSLAGAVLDALLVLIKAIGEHRIGQPLMHGLLQVVGVNGDPAIVGKAIGTLLCSGGSTVGVKIDDFVTELQSATDDKRKCLALSVLGEAGLRLGTSSPLDPSLFTKYFNSKSQQLPRAAAVALGRAGAGNISAYLPVILSSSSKSGSAQYLSLHAIKEILQSTGQVRAEIAPYTRKIWDTLLVASQGEDNKAVGAECIGRLAIIEPKTFLPLLSVRTSLRILKVQLADILHQRAIYKILCLLYGVWPFRLSVSPCPIAMTLSMRSCSPC